MLRRTFVGTAVTVLLARSVMGADTSWRIYMAESFAAEQAAGRTILVAVHADWCPTCRQQAPILESALAEPAMAEVVAVRVDFDADKDFLAVHRIAQQSTILIFKGDREVGRVIAETDPERLRAFVMTNAA